MERRWVFSTAVRPDAVTPSHGYGSVWTNLNSARLKPLPAGLFNPRTLAAPDAGHALFRYRASASASTARRRSPNPSQGGARRPRRTEGAMRLARRAAGEHIQRRQALNGQVRELLGIALAGRGV